MSADANANEAVVRETIDGFYRAFEQKSVELLRKVVTADWEYVPEPPGAVPGPDQMVHVFEQIATAIPDMKVHILDLLIHGDRVGVRAEISGTQTGTLLGIAASSKHIQLRDSLLPPDTRESDRKDMASRRLADRVPADRRIAEESRSSLGIRGMESGALTLIMHGSSNQKTERQRKQHGTTHAEQPQADEP